MSLFIEHYPQQGKDLSTSGYLWWYLFMQLVDGYGPEHPLWTDFGDVTGEFIDWWYAHDHLFYDGFMDGVERYQSLDELQAGIDLYQSRGTETWIVGIRPGLYSRKQLTQQFNWLLDNNGVSKSPGAKPIKQQKGMAKYPFHQRPNTQALNIMYQCWIIHNSVEKNGGGITHYQIAQKLGISPENWIDESKDTKKTQSDKKNRMGAIFGRYLHKANRLIANLSEGRFPDYR